MTLIATVTASESILAVLANSALRALALSGVAGLGIVAFRVKSTSVRLLSWTAVLYGALAMPLLQWMVPGVSIPVPAVLKNGAKSTLSGLPAASSANSTAFMQEQAAVTGLSSEIGIRTASPSRPDRKAQRGEMPPLMTAPMRSRSSVSSLSWTTITAGIYLSFALLLLGRFFIGLAFSRRLLRTSREIHEPRLTSRLARCAHASGLTSLPTTVESELISVPLTMGVLRPTILLPRDWREWNDPKLDAVLAHEVSHIARHDALTQRLSVLHRAIFWFSPLAWWLDRRLADLAEQASDEAALTGGADRKVYATTLLGFFEALQTAPGRVWWQGVSMAKEGQAEKRVERILSWKGSAAMRFKRSISVAVLALAVPAVYLAASVHPAVQTAILRNAELAQNQTPAAPPREAVPAPEAQPDVTPAPPTAQAPTAATTPDSEPTPAAIGRGPSTAPVAASAPSAGAPTFGAPAYAPVAPIAPVSSAPAIAWDGQSTHSRSSYGRGYSYAYGYDDEQRFVIVSGKSDSLTMSGTTEDARHVEKLRKQIPGDFIWFQRDEKSYVIRDQATIDRARKLWAPQDELGKKQEELGKQQEALGKQQEALSAKMEQIHVNVPDMTAELDKLKAELKQLSSGATVEQVGRIQSEIGDLQSKIGELQSKAGDQQGKLGEQMGALGEKQGKLGEQQGELGRLQEELARDASQKMKQLLDEAIAKGIAQLEL
jgi:beta-lactamase regulating signal transducer with metallopeptidase domain